MRIHLTQNLTVATKSAPEYEVFYYMNVAPK